MMSLNLEPDERDFVASMELNCRKVSDEDIKKFEGYTAEIFTAFGMDLNPPPTRDTLLIVLVIAAVFAQGVCQWI